MHWLLIGYMFLFIDRPFEVWPWLGDLHVERVYMLFTLAMWVVYPNKRWLPNLQHAAYAAFGTAVVLGWAMSPYAEKGQPLVEDWFKIVVFYGLLVTTVHEERGLKRLAAGFMCVMGLYLLHSLREYVGGRYTYRMGIARMVGVDTSLGDPNSFGASIVFALPLVTALWRAEVWGKLGRKLLLGYVGLSSLCILLTGSRSSLLGLLLWFTLMILGHRRRGLMLGGFLLAAPMAFLALPPSLQNRFETIINPEVGPASAQESGEGRIEGLLTGLSLWASNPLTGVGPGAWRPATGSKLESHNLYGQIVGELGTVGLLAFLGILFAFWQNLRAVKRIRKAVPEWHNDLPLQLPAAIGTAIVLLLFMGNFGHNLFRFTWLWFGGFLVISHYCVNRRLAMLNDPDAWPDEAYDEVAESEDAWDEEAAEFEEDGWVPHPPHAIPAR